MNIFKSSGATPKNENPAKPGLMRGIIIGVGVLVVLVAASSFSATVPAGYVGVKTTFGSPSSSMYSPGIHFRIPIAQSMNNVYVGVNKATSDVAGSSKDLQQVDMKVSINFNILPASATSIFVTYSSDPWTTVMDPAVHDIAKAVTARYDATDLIQKRDQVSQEMREALLNRFQNIGVNVSAVNIVDFQFSKQFNDAIEAKITAQQNAQRVENEIAQTRWEAQKRVVESEAALQVAENTAKANDILGKSLVDNPSLLEKMRIEKWDGHYPSTMLGNSIPMIKIGQSN
ncbi:prohibitin family protein [Paraburkholderia sp. Ac-20336]|uniref:prohibitin family protein n=1 Tax=Burkholderiaceae TaxID=119060 RepID=UPI00141DD5DE|nr:MULTISPECIES: prohibitin family protein [Burkholderiaceae]MBN3806527.1 prohibitin family protein [Paraburkholderia sp. Ac-20336]MBN3851112.1 prohibitin family protein [Paraburkholderia sp. Ac-20342]